MTGAAFFDVDKTLVRVNTSSHYVRWRVMQRTMSATMLAKATWWGALYRFGMLDVQRIGETAAETLTGIAEDGFRHECATWVRREMDRHITREARAEVARHQREGTPVVLLTSTSPYIAEPVASILGVSDVLSSKMEVTDGRFTGRLAGPLCYGPYKVHAARRYAEERGVDLAASSFYTDSVTDLPMLEAVGEPRVINPDPRLSRLARQRGWRVETWM
ncbi:MAG: HAD family hydrolase [Sandaracinaceae bacterium]